MLFNLEDNGEVAVQKLLKILLDTHSNKSNASNSLISDIEFARVEKLNSEIPDTCFVDLNIAR